jgi:glycerol transport system permease protein
VRNYVWLFAPALIVLLIIGLVPIFPLVNYSVQTPFQEENRFVGFDHFKRMYSDSRWINAIQRTLLLSLIILAIEIPLGLVLAYFFHRPGILNSVASAAIILPALFPYVSIGLMWRLMTSTVGPLGKLLNAVGLNYNIAVNATQAFATIIIMDVWHWTSLTFLVLSAAFAAMDPTPIMAARTEGATRWQIFRYIQLPNLMFPLLFVILLRLIDSLRIFDEVYVLTSGGPGFSTEFVSQYIRNVALEQWNFGYGSALSLVYLFMIIVLSVITLNVLTRGKGVL